MRALLVRAAALAASAPATGQERESLEQLLERSRREMEATQARLSGVVVELVDQLEKMDRIARRKREAAVVDRMVALGSEATPLLVAYLDPGASEEEPVAYRAGRVADALERMDVAPIQADLVAVLKTGSPRGQHNAAHVLAAAADPSTVRPEILSTFRTAKGALRASCLQTLIAMGGEGEDALLAEVLAGKEPELIDMALTALAERASGDVAPEVRAILMDRERAELHAKALIAYYRALPELVHDEEAEAFLRVVRGNASIELRIAVIEALPDFGLKLADVRRGLEPITISREDDLREAGLATLARLSDRSARKKLLEAYDDDVEDNPRWAKARARRASVYYRIGDYGHAIDDYEKAIELTRLDGRSEPDYYAELARCQVREGKLKDARDTLRRSPLSLSRLHEMADEPDFRELRDSKYGDEAFGLEG